MSTTRLQTYISGSGWRPCTPSIYIAGGGWKNVRSMWVYESGAWKLVVALAAPSAADNTVFASLVGGALSHVVNFNWDSLNEQVYFGGRVHVYLDGVEIALVGFSQGANHSIDYTIPDTYGTAGGVVVGKVAYLPSSGSTEGTLSPASNSVTVIPWL